MINESGFETSEDDQSPYRVALENCRTLLERPNSLSHLRNVWRVTDAQRPVQNLSYHMNAIIVTYLEKDNTVVAARDLEYLKAPTFKHDLIVQASVTAVESMYRGTISVSEKLAYLLHSLLNSGNITSDCVDAGIGQFYDVYSDLLSHLHIEFPIMSSLVANWIKLLNAKKLVSDEIMTSLLEIKAPCAATSEELITQQSFNELSLSDTQSRCTSSDSREDTPVVRGQAMAPSSSPSTSSTSSLATSQWVDTGMTIATTVSATDTTHSPDRQYLLEILRRIKVEYDTIQYRNEDVDSVVFNAFRRIVIVLHGVRFVNYRILMLDYPTITLREVLTQPEVNEHLDRMRQLQLWDEAADLTDFSSFDGSRCSVEQLTSTFGAIRDARNRVNDATVNGKFAVARQYEDDVIEWALDLHAEYRAYCNIELFSGMETLDAHHMDLIFICAHGALPLDCCDNHGHIKDLIIRS